MAEQIPGIVYQALQNSVPEMDDAEKVKMWNDVVTRYPEATTMDPKELARTIVNIAKETRATTLKNPYAGTKMAERNPENPQAELLNQFDPQQLKAAYADYASRYNDTLPRRNVSQWLAASGGPEVLQSSKDSWNRLDAQNKLMSLDQQKALQSQATEGLAAGTVAQNQFKTAGEYSTNQQKQLEDIKQAKQKTESGALDIQSKRDLYDPNSPQTALAKSLLTDQLNAGGPRSPELLNMLRNPNVTAQQLMGFMDPKVLEAYQKKVGIRKTEVETDKTRAEIPGVQAETQVKQGVAAKVSPTAQQDADIESLRIIRDEHDKLPDGHPDKPGLFREMMAVRKKIGPKLADTAPGTTQMGVNMAGVNIQPSAQAQTESAAAGKGRVEDQDRYKNYKANVEPLMDEVDAMLNKNIYTGKFTDTIARLVPRNEQAVLLSKLAQINAMYPGVLPPDLGKDLQASQKAGGFSGAILGTLEPDQLRGMIKTAKNAVERQQSIRAEQNKFENAGGRSSEFVPSSQPKPAAAIPTIKSKADFDKLPSGAEFIDPDGKKRRKP